MKHITFLFLLFFVTNDIIAQDTLARDPENLEYLRSIDFINYKSGTLTKYQELDIIKLGRPDKLNQIKNPITITSYLYENLSLLQRHKFLRIEFPFGYWKTIYLTEEEVEFLKTSLEYIRDFIKDSDPNVKTSYVFSSKSGLLINCKRYNWEKWSVILKIKSNIHSEINLDEEVIRRLLEAIELHKKNFSS